MENSLKLIEKFINNIKLNLKLWNIDSNYIKEQMDLIKLEIKHFKKELNKYCY